MGLYFSAHKIILNNEPILNKKTILNNKLIFFGATQKPMFIHIQNNNTIAHFHTYK